MVDPSKMMATSSSVLPLQSSRWTFLHTSLTRAVCIFEMELKSRALKTWSDCPLAISVRCLMFSN